MLIVYFRMKTNNLKNRRLNIENTFAVVSMCVSCKTASLDHVGRATMLALLALANGFFIPTWRPAALAPSPLEARRPAALRSAVAAPLIARAGGASLGARRSATQEDAGWWLAVLLFGGFAVGRLDR